MTFDVVVVGAGPGGYVSAIRAAQLGLKTALIEGHKLGGECLNYGCIPSKALITAGSLVSKIQNLAPKMGIEVQGVKVDMAKLVDWKGGIVKSLTGGVGQLLKANGVQVFKGTATFEGISADGKVKTLNVNGALDSYDQTKITGESQKVEALNVILATGSYTVEVPAFPFNGKNILGSKQALEVNKIPKKLAVIGGGFIGLEIGTYFSKLGAELEVIEATDTLLPGTDRECVDVVQKRLVKKGVKLHMSSKALGVKDLGDKGVEIEIENAEGKKKIAADWVLVTVGRRPRTAQVGLDKVGIKPDARGFIPVNAHLQTSVPGIYAIGDIIGGPMLAHKASYEGMIAAEHIHSGKGRMDVRALPWAIFVDPEISTVGHTLESAKAAGWDPVVGKCPFVANGRALTTGDAEGFVKIIGDRKTDRLLGAHMVGPEVSNLIAEVAAFIEMGGTVQDLIKTIHSHPTLPETLLEAAESVHGMAVHFFERKARKQQSPDTHA